MDDGTLDAAVAKLGPRLLGALAALELAERRLHPPTFATVREKLAAFVEPLDDARSRLRRARVPSDLERFGAQLARAADCAAEALARMTDARGDVVRVLEGMHFHRRADAALYPLRRALPAVSRFYVEDAFADRLAALDPEPPRERTGVHEAASEPGQRGGFALYVPESREPGERLPLVVALHGGSGHGSDFLWTWLREARSRRCLLLAPTSLRSTWSLMGGDVDTPNLHRMIDAIDADLGIDRERVLLTGLSDGATFALLCGLREDSPFTALAPVSGVLHPANFANGNVERARGRRIRLVHGALDWMFPVGLARAAADALARAGAELEYREIADLSHTYPREENARILDWMGVAGR